jgi:hypothetical protein
MTTVDSFAPANTRSSGLALRTWAREDANFPLYAILVLVLVWIAAIATWGLPALYLPAVVAAVLMLGVLVAITRG